MQELPPMSTVVLEDITRRVVQLQAQNKVNAQLNPQGHNTQVILLVKSEWAEN
jgi:hypothetical protein